MSKIKNTNSAQRGYRNWEGGGGGVCFFWFGVLVLLVVFVER